MPSQDTHPLDTPPSTPQDQIKETSPSSEPTSFKTERDEATRKSFERYFSKMRKWRRLGVWFAATLMILPVIGAILYVYFIATPMYSTETRFEIRSMSDGPQIPIQGSGGASNQSSAGIGSFLSGGGGSLAASGFVDGYAVRDFLQSREAMTKLKEKIDLPSLLRVQLSPNAPNDENNDKLYRAYTANIRIRYNMTEQILVLDIFAYTPNDAVQISNALLSVSDEFVNGLNERVLKDAMKVAEEDLGHVQDRAAQAHHAMADWRNANKNIDPTTEVTMLMNMIAQFESELSTTQTNLALINAVRAFQHPQRHTLQVYEHILKNKIAATRRQLGGSTNANATSAISTYEKLKATQDFTDQAVLAALQSVDQARATMLRQQRYVSIVAEPVASGTPTSPARLTFIIETLLAAISLAFIGSMIFGYIRDAATAKTLKMLG